MIAMTVIGCYESAVAFLPEELRDNVEMQEFAVRWCNVLLADCRSAENAYRKKHGQTELAVPLSVSSKTDVIPYNDALVQTAFPYGMARWVFRENEDVDGSREYYSMYTAAITESTPVITGEIEDIY